MPPSERERKRESVRWGERERSPGVDVELCLGWGCDAFVQPLSVSVLARLDLVMTHRGCLLDSNAVTLRGVSSLGRDLDLGSQWGKSLFVD